jgi:hypothetical protein
MVVAGRRARTPLVQVLLAALLVAVLPSCTGAMDKHQNATGTEPPGPPSASTQAPSGASPVGAHWDWSRLQAFEPYLRTVPGTVTFDELVWCDVEPSKGVQSWRAQDKIAQTAQALGIRLLLKIRVGVCWSTGGKAQHVRGRADKTESAMPQDLDAYRAFVSQVVKRYAGYGVDEYAFENEVNSPSYWSGSPSDYMRLVDAGARAARAADPTVIVADAGMSSTSYGYGISDRLLRAGDDAAAVAAWNSYFSRRIGTRGEQIPKVSSGAGLRAALASVQGRRNLEYLGVAREMAAKHATDVRQVHFYEDWNAVPLLLDYLHGQTPQGTPIEAWEVGSFWKGATGTAEQRADDMVRVEAGLLAGGLRLALWLPLASQADNRRGEEIRYGLLEPDGGIRPAGRAMQSLVAASRGAAVVPVESARLRGVAFQAKARTTLVVWATSGTVQVPLVAGARAASPGASPTAAAGAVTVGVRPMVLDTSETVEQVLSATR